MTIARSIPQTTLPTAGSYGTASALASNVNQIKLTLTQIDWPLVGDKAFDYMLEQSNDGGASWFLLTSSDVGDVAQTTVRGSINNQFVITASLENVGLSTRRCRVRWENCKSGITVSGVIEVFTIDKSALRVV